MGVVKFVQSSMNPTDCKIVRLARSRRRSGSHFDERSSFRIQQKKPSGLENVQEIGEPTQRTESNRLSV
ncbi:hypothetical protein KIN20_028017 [Parelaphostrongylus tenuis]|uniref:Uncharacterized protein n=1 Tax=Parelaphostrongylus tenuis TaxID=148309 RepID=A0AAD5WEF0_PARTN|nr:hypothetical protein KIN20_028017 [Parelaphostrongylus tenuis]